MPQTFPEAGLLAADEPDAVSVYKPAGASPFVLVADHAGNTIPRAIGRLGIAQPDCRRHIAWDIGIAGLATQLADALGAVLIRQNYSRLVIDCNRPLSAPTSIPEISEWTAIPGNVGLSDSDRTMRQRTIFRPYHDRISAELDRRREAGIAAVLVALHSFTPSFKNVARSWHAALLSNRDRRLAERLLALLRKEGGLVVGDNEPYFVSDETDYTIPVHGERRGLLHALIEIRQDLIADDAGQRTWAAILARILPFALHGMAGVTGGMAGAKSGAAIS